MATRSAAWLIPFTLLAVNACSRSSDNTGAPGSTADPALDASADAPPDAPLDVRAVSGAVGASPAALDLGVALPKQSSRIAAVDITNRGFLDVTLSPVTVSAPFGIFSQSCGTVLAAGASCFVLVSVTPTVIGPLAGTLTLPTSANTLIVPLRAGGGFMVSVRVNADGAQVASDPAGLAPSSAVGLYQGLFSTAVTLTSVPPPGGTFLGWDPACGDGGPTCVVPVPGRGAGEAVSIMARFQPALGLGPKITVDLTGGATGEVFIVDDATATIVTSCTSPCVASVPAGHKVTVSGFSSSQFGGWTGDCVATTHDCDLGAVTSDRDRAQHGSDLRRERHARRRVLADRREDLHARKKAVQQDLGSMACRSGASPWTGVRVASRSSAATPSSSAGSRCSSSPRCRSPGGSGSAQWARGIDQSPRPQEPRSD